MNVPANQHCNGALVGLFNMILQKSEATNPRKNQFLLEAVTWMCPKNRHRVSD